MIGGGDDLIEATPFPANQKKNLEHKCVVTLKIESGPQFKLHTPQFYGIGRVAGLEPV